MSAKVETLVQAGTEAVLEPPEQRETEIGGSRRGEYEDDFEGDDDFAGDEEDFEGDEEDFEGDDDDFEGDDDGFEGRRRRRRRRRRSGGSSDGGRRRRRREDDSPRRRRRSRRDADDQPRRMRRERDDADAPSRSRERCGVTTGPYRDRELGGSDTIKTAGTAVIEFRSEFAEFILEDMRFAGSTAGFSVTRIKVGTTTILDTPIDVSLFGAQTTVPQRHKGTRIPMGTRVRIEGETAETSGGTLKAVLYGKAREVIN